MEKNTKSSNKYVQMLLDNLNNLKNYLLKPMESEKSDDLKSVGITGLILSVSMVIINLIMTMITSLKQTSISFTGKVSSTFSFDGLSEINYLSLIFKNLLIYIVVMLVIAGVFYIMSLIFKKEAKFTKLLSITYVAAIPFFLGTVVVSGILGLIYSPLAIISTIIFTVYSISVFASLVNSEVKLKDIMKVYYNTASYSLLLIIVYFVIVKILLEAVSSIGSLFGGF